MQVHDHWASARVVRFEDLTPTIRLFELEPLAGYLPWTPGAHLRVQVAVDGRTELRCYSLIDDGSRDRCYRIAVKLMPGGMGGSRAMWALAAGDEIQISQPQNHFSLSPQAASYTLVAGGVGITPLLGMAHQLSRGDRPVRMYYAMRNRQEAAFAGLLHAWLGERIHLQVEAEGGRLDLAAIVDGIPADGELYLCGPLTMLEAARTAWQAAGRAVGNLRFETFAASGHQANLAFTAVLPRFNREIQVAADQTLLGALEDAGIELPSGCRRGECGLCALPVLACDSAIDHRDVFFSKEQQAEGRRLCACVSRPVGGRIELDTWYRGPAG